ncbi:PA3496 family putative envelope integrity protein [Sessilibacter sp. MAH2]
MRDELTNDDFNSSDVLNSIGDELDNFTAKNLQIDARRRLEDALEERRLSRELREFDFDDIDD